VPSGGAGSAATGEGVALTTKDEEAEAVEQKVPPVEGREAAPEGRPDAITISPPMATGDGVGGSGRVRSRGGQLQLRGAWRRRIGRQPGKRSSDPAVEHAGRQDPAALGAGAWSEGEEGGGVLMGERGEGEELGRRPRGGAGTHRQREGRWRRGSCRGGGGGCGGGGGGETLIASTKFVQKGE
jgi:hypothetical protein